MRYDYDKEITEGGNWARQHLTVGPTFTPNLKGSIRLDRRRMTAPPGTSFASTFCPRSRLNICLALAALILASTTLHNKFSQQSQIPVRQGPNARLFFGHIDSRLFPFLFLFLFLVGECCRRVSARAVHSLSLVPASLARRLECCTVPASWLHFREPCSLCALPRVPRLVRLALSTPYWLRLGWRALRLRLPARTLCSVHFSTALGPFASTRGRVLTSSDCRKSPLLNSSCLPRRNSLPRQPPPAPRKHGS